jgi:trehalose 6-phosphate synthase
VTLAGRMFDLVVAANRLPVDRVGQGGIGWRRSPGGLVTAMEPVMAGRDGVWVGWAGESGPAPEPFTENGLHLHPVSLSPVEMREYYEGFSNGTLWPIYHDVMIPASFHRGWWNTYRTVNHRFAQVIILAIKRCHMRLTNMERLIKVVCFFPLS